MNELWARMPRAMRTSVVAVIAVVMASVIPLGSSPTAFAHPVRAAYSCISPHCYGQVTWPGYNHGASSDISIADMTCTPADCFDPNTDYLMGFVDNEFWVADDTSAQCAPGGSIEGACWVEDGYGTFTDYSGTTEQYFWADARGGADYNEHPLGSIPQADYGNDTYFQVSDAGNGTWDVYVSSAHFYKHQQSTSNYMSPNFIPMGEELYGNNGASANRAYYLSNQFEATNNTWHFQTVNGTLSGSNPPWVGWTTPPSSSQSGGELWTNT